MFKYVIFVTGGISMATRPRGRTGRPMGKTDRITSVMQLVGAQLKQMRRARKMTLAETVSQMKSISAAHFNRVENGHANLAICDLPMIFTALKATPEEVKVVMAIIFGESVIPAIGLFSVDYSKDDVRALLYWISAVDLPVSEDDLNYLIEVQHGQPKFLNSDLIRGLLRQRNIA